MADTYLRHVANPHGLLPLDERWLQPVRDFDPQLRIFPSQKRGVYRLARVNELMAPMAAAKFPRETVHPDTAVCLTEGLVPLNWSLVGNISIHPASLIVDVLRRRDTWAHRRDKHDVGSETVNDLVESLDAQEQRDNDRAFKERTRAIGREARLAVLYRTGQRVSLVKPPAVNALSGFRMAPTAPSSTPSSPVTSAAPVGAGQ